MEILTLATTALTLAKPFLDKIGEGTSRKIGEDIWNLIKSPFLSKEKKIEELKEEERKEILITYLQSDPELRSELEKEISNIQNNYKGDLNQIINNNGQIGKQVNITNNHGDLNF